MVPLANAPTWVKALWVEKELQARGLWQDDVFDLVRPFLVTPKSSVGGAEKKPTPKPAPTPAPTPDPVDLSQIVISTPHQTADEARWAPSPDELEAEESEDKAGRSAFGDDSERVKTPSEYLKFIGLDADSPESDGTEGESAPTVLDASAGAA